METRIDSFRTETRRLGSALVAIVVFLVASSPASYSMAQGPSPPPSASCLCTMTSAGNLAHLAYASAPLYENQKIVRFVERNATLLSANGPTITCASRLGDALLRRGIANLPRRSVWDRAYESAIFSGADMQQARNIADAAARTDDPALVQAVSGEDLLWLATVIPQAAAGDWVPYWQTGGVMRRMSRAQVPQHSANCQMMEAMGMWGACQAMERAMKDLMVNTLPHMLYSWSCSFPAGY
jgi:hypothetical protein